MMKILLLVAIAVGSVAGHGRLIEPAGRSTLWRQGYSKAVVNYNDNELFCGGFDRQYVVNGGKCGICGDPWDTPAPRENEDGGEFGKGIVARSYHQGDEIVIVVQITAHHMGYFEFKVCPVTRKDQVPDQECLDKYPLSMADGSGSKYHLPLGSTIGDYPIRVKLPKDLTCQRCVLQWHYNTGNRWGTCTNGTSGMGCGPQETFRGCADVEISAKTVSNGVDYEKERQRVEEEAKKSSAEEAAATNEAPREVAKESDKGCGGVNKETLVNELTDDQKIRRAILQSRLGKYLA